MKSGYNVPATTISTLCLVIMNASFAVGNVTPPGPVLPLRAPALSDYPPAPPNITDTRFDFALHSLEWISTLNKDSPDLKIDPATGFSPAQWQMIEVINVLQGIPDSAADKEANEQKAQRENVVWDAIREGVKEGAQEAIRTGVFAGPLKGAKEGVKAGTKASAKVIVKALGSTVTGDGNGPLRDGMVGQAYKALLDAGHKTNPDSRSYIQSLTETYHKSGGAQSLLKDATKSTVTWEEFQRRLDYAEHFRDYMRAYQAGIQDARTQGVNEERGLKYNPVTGPVPPFCRNCNPGPGRIDENSSPHPSDGDTHEYHSVTPPTPPPSPAPPPPSTRTTPVQPPVPIGRP